MDRAVFPGFFVSALQEIRPRQGDTRVPQHIHNFHFASCQYHNYPSIIVLDILYKDFAILSTFLCNILNIFCKILRFFWKITDILEQFAKSDRKLLPIFNIFPLIFIGHCPLCKHCTILDRNIELVGLESLPFTPGGKYSCQISFSLLLNASVIAVRIPRSICFQLQLQQLPAAG